MKIVLIRADGNISVSFLSDGADIAREIEVIEESLSTGIIGWREVTNAELPNRRFREAWNMPDGIDGAIVVDPAKARVIRKKELEKQQSKVLERLRDKIEEAEDDGLPARVTTLKTKRKTIRTLDLAAALANVSVEELGTFEPTEFGL